MTTAVTAVFHHMAPTTLAAIVADMRSAMTYTVLRTPAMRATEAAAYTALVSMVGKQKADAMVDDLLGAPECDTDMSPAYHIG